MADESNPKPLGVADVKHLPNADEETRNDSDMLSGVLAGLRVGTGVDVHSYTDPEAEREMWIGCLFWPCEAGLEGHSDADVVAHALCDAILSAAGLGDLGSNFGTAQPQWAGASGESLLTETIKMVHDHGFKVLNASVQLVANRPRIGNRRAEVENKLTQVVGAPVSFGATTTDGLGFTGRSEGAMALANALLLAG